MLERKHKVVLFLNLKKLANPVDDLKIILILQNEMLLLILFCKHVLKQWKDIPMLPITVKRAIKLELVNTQLFTFNKQTVQVKKNQQPLKTISLFAPNQFLLTSLKCLPLVTPSSIKKSQKVC